MNAFTLSENHIRFARSDEAQLLSDLALRSKGHWGYDETFLKACRDDLTFTTDEIQSRPFWVLEKEGRVIAFYDFKNTANGLYLNNLFVAPEEINRGFGRQLWQHAVQFAKSLGHQAILIASDPHAEGFYQSMGAKRIGGTPSSVFDGRNLPLLKFEFR